MTNQFSAFSAIVVDDEPLPRSHLVHILREFGLQSVNQAGSATECLQLLDNQSENIDWAFIDIQMPDMDGLSLADAINAGYFSGDAPAIAFVTGYDDYAIQAFERAAIDYLLKPVSRERLAVTMDRLASRSAGRLSIAAAETAPQPPIQIQRLPIRVNYAVHLIDVDKIIAAYAHDKRVEIITSQNSYSTYYTLSQLEQRLAPSQFLRVHDSWLVNIGNIIEIHNLGSQSYELRIRGMDKMVPVSRRKYASLEQRLGI
jgi:DNA-binding LytR/AlgR family response regulator